MQTVISCITHMTIWSAEEEALSGRRASLAVAPSRHDDTLLIWDSAQKRRLGCCVRFHTSWAHAHIAQKSMINHLVGEAGQLLPLGGAAQGHACG